MPRTYRGSSATPLLADYLRANQQQGAQQAGALSQRLAQEGQQVRSAVDEAQAKVEAARLAPIAENMAHLTSSDPLGYQYAPFVYEQAPSVINGPAVDFSGAGVNSGALQQQVGQAASNAGLTGSLAGIGALNAQKFGYGAAGASTAPRSTGASMLDAAAMQAGGGKQLRAAGRQNMGLRDYLGGAESRGNEAAVAKVKQATANPLPPENLGAPRGNAIQTPGTMPASKPPSTQARHWWENLPGARRTGGG